MALITLSTRVNGEPFSMQRCDVDLRKAGEALTAGWAVRVHSDGTIMGAVTTTAETQTLVAGADVVTSDFIGFVLQDYAIGDAVSVYSNGLKINLADATLTPGVRLYVSATKGILSNLPINKGDSPVAIALTSSLARCIR